MTRPVHLCPGCGRGGVPNHLFACAPCWSSLPREVQRRIWDTVGARPDVRAAAVAAATEVWDACAAARAERLAAAPQLEVAEPVEPS